MDDQANQQVSSGGMSKTPIIIAVVVALLVLGIGGYVVMGKGTIKPASIQMTAQPKVSPTPSGMFSTIQEALSKSLSLKCDYKENGMVTTAYIKAGTIRTDMMADAGSTATKAVTTDQGGSVIVKDKKMYFWNGKKGFMMEFDPSDFMKQMPSVSPAAKNSSEGNGQSMMANLERFKENCKPATVDDKLFTPPADVTFTDMSKMMPSGIKLPSGVPAPSGMTQEQIQQMQKQMMDKYKTNPQGQ